MNRSDKYPWEGSKKCAQRAIRSALRFAGVTNDQAEWATCHTWPTLEALCERYPELEWIGKNEPVAYRYENQPALVVHKGDFGEHEGLRADHIVFVSDMTPINEGGLSVCYAVIGWEELRERIEEERKTE